MKVYTSGTRIAGRYEVVQGPHEKRSLEGGMGIVYLCLDHEEDRPVALKTFKPEYLPDRATRERFLHEGTHWVDLGVHPHIVRAHKVIRSPDGREVYLVLELIAREQGHDDASLHSWLKSSQPLPIETALLFALQIARGMGHAVKRIPGFVHRDLKPKNVLIGADRLSNADVNRLRVTDFGLATVLKSASEQIDDSTMGESEQGARNTQLTRGIVGTPLYMAPEQWRGEQVTVATDVYAFGCILHEMLAGQHTAAGHSLEALQRTHCEGNLRPLPPNLPEPVHALLTRYLALEPGERYEDWNQVEGVLTAAYEELVGRSVPSAEPVTELGRTECVTVGWSYNAIGLSYLDIGKAELALRYFEQAQDVGEAEGEPKLVAAGLTHLGLTYADLGDASLAISYHKDALAILREIADRRGEVAALGNLGLAYKNLGDARRAIDYYEQCLTIHRELGDRRGESADLSNLGSAYQDLGDVHRAIGYFEQSLEMKREIRDRRGEGNTLNNLGDAYRNLGDARCALQYYEQALKIAREIGNRRGEGVALGSLGLAYKNLGKAHRAIDYCKQALAILREIGDRRKEGATLNNLGNAYLNLGDARRAIQYHKQSLVILREVGDRRGEGAALDNSGSAYRELGDVRRAIAHYEQALKIEREIGDRRGEGNTLGNLGSAYDDLDNARRAIDCYEQSLAILREIGDLMGVASNLFNMALLYARQGTPEQALPLAQQAVGIFNKIGHKQRAQRAQQLMVQLRGEAAPSGGPSPKQILQQFASVIKAVVAATHAHHQARASVEEVLPELEQKGWRIADPIQRIWDGERDESILTAGIDSNSALIIREILKQLKNRGGG